MRNRLTAAILSVGLLAGCAEDPATPLADRSAPSSQPTTKKANPTPGEPSKTPSPRRTERGTTIVAAQSDFGTILFDDTGQAIYLFDIETTSQPRCYGRCADDWPPVLTDGAPIGGDRVKPSLLGTTPRTPGTTQVTYDGHPLYFYAHEGKREVKCHDVFLNGGNWYAVQPEGSRAP